MKTGIVPFALLLGSLPALGGDADFTPISPQVAAKYRFNLATSFYPDEQIFANDLQTAMQLAERMQQYRGKVTSSGRTLYEISQLTEKLNLLSQKLYVYRYLSYATDTKLQPQLSEIDRVVSHIASRTAFISTELRQLSESDLNRLIQEDPRLEVYRFFLVQNTRYKPHTLPTAQEELLGALSPQLYSWQSQFFQKLIDRTTFSKIKTEAGELDVYRDRQVLSKNKNRDTRKESLLKLYDEYAASADLYGFILIKQADALNTTASIRKHPGAFANSLFDAYLTKEQVEGFFAEVSRFAPLMQQYIEMRKQRIKEISGIDTVEPWDMEVVPQDYERPRFTIEQTTDILLKALAFHGEQYSSDLADLMNPDKGRLDIVKGANRVPGAFAWGYYGAPFVFYSFAFHGYVDDILTLAHEGGHVAHYDLIFQNKVPAIYSDGPAYFTESFAMLNEFITVDYLYENAKSKDDKVYFLEQWLSVAMRRFFDIVMRSEFEYRAYQQLKANEITDAEQIHQLWQQEGLKYVGDDYKRHDFLKYNWTFTPHFFTSPRYYMNYMVANLMAISYYQKHYNDPQFDGRYVELIKAGFPDTPLNLLQKYLDLNPFDPSTVQESMQVFKQKLAQLQALYSST